MRFPEPRSPAGEDTTWVTLILTTHGFMRGGVPASGRVSDRPLRSTLYGTELPWHEPEGDPGAFIPRGVGACESSASSPFFGGAVGSRWGEGSGYGACLLRGAPLAQPALRWSFRYTFSLCGIVAALCLLLSLACLCAVTVVVCYK